MLILNKSEKTPAKVWLIFQNYKVGILSGDELFCNQLINNRTSSGVDL